MRHCLQVLCTLLYSASVSSPTIHSHLEVGASLTCDQETRSLKLRDSGSQTLHIATLSSSLFPPGISQVRHQLLAMKYVLVSGGGMSGIGKGIIASSTGLLLKTMGLKVTAIKIDPYLNIGKVLERTQRLGQVFMICSRCWYHESPRARRGVRPRRWWRSRPRSWYYRPPPDQRQSLIGSAQAIMSVTYRYPWVEKTT